MATQTPQPVEDSTEQGGSTCVTLNMSLSGTQQEPRHQLVHRNDANTATKNITKDAHLTIVVKLETAGMRNSTQLDVSIVILR